MKYANIKEAEFLSRPNRFIAHIEIDGREEICHVKNTGRCKELLIPGANVFVQAADHGNRKTKYDLIAVHKGERLINIDSQVPNKVFHEWILSGDYFPGIGLIKPESRYGSSRFDFYMEAGDRKILVEVKGVTLEEEGALLDHPSAATGEASPVTGSNPRGKGRRHSSSAPAALPPSTRSISPANPGSDSSVSQAPATSSGTAATSISLTQYLGNLFCTGCSKYCSLLSPQCNIGFEQTAAAQQQYIAIYGAAD